MIWTVTPESVTLVVTIASIQTATTWKVAPILLWLSVHTYKQNKVIMEPMSNMLYIFNVSTKIEYFPEPWCAFKIYDSQLLTNARANWEIGDISCGQATVMMSLPWFRTNTPTFVWLVGTSTTVVTNGSVSPAWWRSIDWWISSFTFVTNVCE